MEDDKWLERWLPLVRERAGERQVLELGCGRGRDTAVLVAAGLGVIALDQSSNAIAEARARAPTAEFHCQDLRMPFPPEARNLGAVLASLSLHYFRWIETERLIQRIADTLSVRGVLVCRVNATDDFNFGASGHPEIEPNLYLVGGQAKRFFDLSSLDQLFAHWTIVSREHHTIDRYSSPKAVWEIVASRPLW
jgi:SAM-dependent methyltransferase